MSITVAQKKRGRPKTGESPRVAFRLEHHVIARINDVANAEGISFSEAARRLIEKALDSE